MSDKKNILFLCTGNSCRSQMAEGFCNHLMSESYAGFSAGIEKHGLNRNAVSVMKEAGVDITNHYSKTTDDIKNIEFDYVITVCGHADENCPWFPAKTKIIHHGFEDPPRMAEKYNSEEEKLDCYRRVRDEIEVFIKKLKKNL